MAAKIDSDLVDQVQLLLQQSRGPFPYEECRKILKDVSEALPGQEKHYEDLIPDLSNYFYLVDSYASGILQVLARPSSELVRARGLLKNSFFQAHSRYKSLEWRINQINTPDLYKRISVSNQLRQILLELTARQLANEQQISRERQEKILSLAS